MGMSESTQPMDSPPSPPPLLQEPWRENPDWDKRDEMKEHLKTFQISNPEVEYLRILVHGPVGAGKSSFINSIDSIFQDRMTCGAIAEKPLHHSFTRSYKTHRIKDGKYGSYLSFAICDVMGLERDNSEGVQTTDLKKILDGYITDGYMFFSENEEKESSAHPQQNVTDVILEDDIKNLNSASQSEHPCLENMIHCLLSVIPADNPLWCSASPDNLDYVMKEEDTAFIKRMKEVGEYAEKVGILQVVVMTKIDQACKNVKTDIKSIYKSEIIQSKVQHCSDLFGVPMNMIFPVKCYHEEIHLNDEVDVLLLSALKHILNIANEHLKGMIACAVGDARDQEAGTSTHSAGEIKDQDAGMSTQTAGDAKDQDAGMPTHSAGCPVTPTYSIGGANNPEKEKDRPIGNNKDQEEETLPCPAGSTKDQGIEMATNTADGAKDKKTEMETDLLADSKDQETQAVTHPVGNTNEPVEEMAS